MSRLEQKLSELGYEFVKPRLKCNNMIKKYIRKFEHTIIAINIGSPSYPEFDNMYIGLPEVLQKRKVLDEINMVYATAVEHQKVLSEFGLNLEEL